MGFGRLTFRYPLPALDGTRIVRAHAKRALNGHQKHRLRQKDKTG